MRFKTYKGGPPRPGASLDAATVLALSVVAIHRVCATRRDFVMCCNVFAGRDL